MALCSQVKPVAMAGTTIHKAVPVDCGALTVQGRIVLQINTYRHGDDQRMHGVKQTLQIDRDGALAIIDALKTTFAL